MSSIAAGIRKALSEVASDKTPFFRSEWKQNTAWLGALALRAVASPSFRIGVVAGAVFAIPLDFAFNQIFLHNYQNWGHPHRAAVDKIRNNYPPTVADVLLSSSFAMITRTMIATVLQRRLQPALTAALMGSSIASPLAVVAISVVATAVLSEQVTFLVNPYRFALMMESRSLGICRSAFSIAQWIASGIVLANYGPAAMFSFNLATYPTRWLVNKIYAIAHARFCPTQAKQ